MSKLFLFIASFLCASTLGAQSIYSYSVTTIEDETKSLNNYQSKKLLLITLPVQQNASNDSILHALDSLRSVHATSLVIIASPSYEDGYLPANKEALKQWYRSILGNNIIVTDGIYTRKASGSQQHPLYKWLTDKTKNGHFDQDVTGPRNKFFVWNDGEQVAVLNGQTRLGGIVMNELLAGQ